jgi:hypothetical protein
LNSALFFILFEDFIQILDEELAGIPVPSYVRCPSLVLKGPYAELSQAFFAV